jgi:hypothetical protein
MLLVHANIPFFASSPYTFFCLLLILANISLFTFVPCCFILVHVKFVRVEIGLGNMRQCNIHSSPYVAHIGGTKIKFSTYYRDQFQHKKIFQGLCCKFRPSFRPTPSSIIAAFGLPSLQPPTPSLCWVWRGRFSHTLLRDMACVVFIKHGQPSPYKRVL